MKKRITIRDVAAAAGVSHQTVSRVLNDRPDVAKETRQHVLQVITELDYQPSAIARSLTQRRTLTLGVVTAGLSYIGPSRTLGGITEQAERMGYALLLKELPRFDMHDLQPLLNSLLARQIDGMIWAVPEVGDNLAWLEDQFGPEWFAPRDAGQHLVSLWKRGQDLRAEELAREMGYDGLQPEYLMAELVEHADD